MEWLRLSHIHFVSFKGKTVLPVCDMTVFIIDLFVIMHILTRYGDRKYSSLPFGFTSCSLQCNVSCIATP